MSTASVVHLMINVLLESPLCNLFLESAVGCLELDMV